MNLILQTVKVVTIKRIEIQTLLAKKIPFQIKTPNYQRTRYLKERLKKMNIIRLQMIRLKRKMLQLKIMIRYKKPTQNYVWACKNVSSFSSSTVNHFHLLKNEHKKRTNP